MSNECIRVAVTGAGGRMGREVVKMVLDDPELQLVAAIDPSNVGKDAGQLVGVETCGITVTDDLELALVESRAQVMVDFTIPQTVMNNTRTAIQLGVRPVVGTTDSLQNKSKSWTSFVRRKGLARIAPNFSIGAILMMKFAAQAAKYMPHVEIIEYHGDQKLDAPSGTSIKTAELIAENRQELKQGNPQEHETIEGARGGYYNGFRIHSVRLPGVFAQQEVIFGGYGQSLKIRHDSYDRAGYMPGVNVAVKKVIGISGIVYGFEHFLD